MKLNFTSFFSVMLVSDWKYRNKSISRNFSDKSKSNDDNFRGVQAIVHYYKQYLVSKEGSGEDGKIYKKNIKSWRIAHVFFSFSLRYILLHKPDLISKLSYFLYSRIVLSIVLNGLWRSIFVVVFTDHSGLGCLQGVLHRKTFGRMLLLLK